MKKLLIILFSFTIIFCTFVNGLSYASSNGVVKELTYAEAVERVAELSGKSIGEVIKDNFKTIENFTNNSSDCSILETQTTIEISNSYHSRLVVFVEACGSGSFRQITTSKQPWYVDHYLLYIYF